MQAVLTQRLLTTAGPFSLLFALNLPLEACAGSAGKDSGVSSLLVALSLELSAMLATHETAVQCV